MEWAGQRRLDMSFYRAEKVRYELLDLGVDAGLLDLRFLKPLDEGLADILVRYKRVYVFSDSYLLGGVGSAILEFMSLRGLSVRLKSFELADSFVPHGAVGDIESALGFDEFSNVILKDLQD